MMLASLITTAVGTLTGGLKDAVVEKITAQARKALKLGPNANTQTIDAMLAKHPDTYAQLVLSANALAKEREETMRVQIAQTGETERAAYQSSDAYVRRARPTLVYVYAFACAVIVCIILGTAIYAWYTGQLEVIVDKLNSAALMVLGSMGAPVGVYVHGRRKEKEAGVAS